MESIFKAFRTGFISIFVPLILVIYILKLAWPLVERISKPISHIIPFHHLRGEIVDFIIGILLILLISIIAGYIVRKTVMKKWTTKVESLITKIFPGYSFYKNFGIRSSGENWKTALFEADSSYTLCFVVEELPNNLVLVYEPSTPGTYSGNIILRKRNQLEILDIPFNEAVKIIREYGVGFSKIYNSHQLSGKIKKLQNSRS